MTLFIKIRGIKRAVLEGYMSIETARNLIDSLIDLYHTEGGNI